MIAGKGIEKLKSYRDTLLGRDDREMNIVQSNLCEGEDDHSHQKDDEREEVDFSGFSIKEGFNGGRPCPNFLMTKKKKKRMCKQ